MRIKCSCLEDLKMILERIEFDNAEYFLKILPYWEKGQVWFDLVIEKYR